MAEDSVEIGNQESWEERDDGERCHRMGANASRTNRSDNRSPKRERSSRNDDRHQLETNACRDERNSEFATGLGRIEGSLRLGMFSDHDL